MYLNEIWSDTWVMLPASHGPKPCGFVLLPRVRLNFIKTSLHTALLYDLTRDGL